MRAILMAAGLGTRLRPLTNDTPKSLVNVNGLPLLERQIINLRENKIDEIVVVTGYLNEKFDELVKKYNLIKIVNEKYAEYNNIYSMYVARDYLSDAYVIDADNYIKNNFLKEKKPENSMYFSACKENIEGEWILRYDDNKKIYKVDIAKDTDKNEYIMSGASYWTEKDGKLLSEKVREAVEDDKRFQIYWDDIAVENLKDMNVTIEKIGSDDIYEIDSIEDLRKLNEILMKN
ncbi:sugar phosphate nucleotidyltransferase [Clostridium sp. BJN0001]|uniref:sugar phosphate nucleotidyltransferase n=1 Tax=Clostridium sp. BJN0001 TaxID=2930219 RepID=UPI001FD365ED|nr:sugar phosphate nucleotidyltransferase [Clostridium sp. BJN0001]